MFILTELIIYATYLVLDITGSMPPISSLLKFFSICLCFFVVDTHVWDIKRIMALTVVADFFLVLTDFYSIGIFFFLLVQMNYYRFLTRGDGFPLQHFATMICTGSVMSVLINFFVIPIDINTFLAVTYFSTLVLNAFIAIRLSPIYNEYRYIAICLCLILCCDIHVAVTNVFSSGIWYSFGLIAMWLFYLPSQVIIAQLYSTKSLSLPYSSQTR